MKKLGLMFILAPFIMSCGIIGGPGVNPPSPPQGDVYALNTTQLDLTIGDQYQLSVTKNGEAYSSVTWTSDYNNYCAVSDTGLLSAYYERSNIIITASISEEIKLTCTVNVYAPTSDIYRLFSTKGQGSVSDKGHVLFIFAKAGTRIDSYTYIYNLTFEYDTFSNICTITSRLSWTQNGYDCVLMGYNIFYWGEYKTGLFGGYYYQTNTSTKVTKTVELSFPNDYLVFSYSDQEIYSKTGGITYVVEQNDFSGDPSVNVEPIFVRVQECASYAKDIFTNYGYNLKLITL